MDHFHAAVERVSSALPLLGGVLLVVLLVAGIDGLGRRRRRRDKS